MGVHINGEGVRLREVRRAIFLSFSSSNWILPQTIWLLSH
ncbi:hypothetical protein QFZ73_003199 [Peribacillus sp. V2I11]|nr:hypothetical protein [Peribacillus sp. V2I11]